MSSGSGERARLAFGDFVLDRERGTLLGVAGELPLRPKAYAVLAYLVERPGRLVSKEELLAAVWGRAIVTDDSLTQCLVEIRRVLGENGRDIIRTVPRRGYLLTAEVKAIGSGMGAVGAGLAEAGTAEAGTAEAGLASGGMATPPASGGMAAPRAPRETPQAHRRRLTSGLLPARHLGFEWLVAILMLVGLFAFMAWRATDPPKWDPVAPPGASTDPSVAVLPFVDMSPDGDHAYFGDGMAEEILNLLAEARGLRVIARTSSFALRDARLDVRAIGRRLGVTHLLEGSVRRSGDRVRVTAQLVDTRDGGHLWAQTYERDLGDVLAVQDDIAASVASMLHASLSGAAGQRREDARSIDPRAYDHLLRGRHLFSRRNDGDLEAARARFEAALALEPGYAEAWVGLAGVRWVLMLEDDLMEEEEIAAFRAAALRSVKLGPGLPEAHLRAMQAHRVAGDLEASARHARIAREIDPENPLLLGFTAGKLLSEGRLEEAIEYQLRALRGDPLSLTIRHNLAIFQLGAGRVKEARRQLDWIRDVSERRDEKAQVLEMTVLLLEGRHDEALALAAHHADCDTCRARRAMTLHALGREDEALASAATLGEGESYLAALGLAEFHAWRGDPDTALRWLETTRERLALEPDVPSTPSWAQLLVLSPFLESVRADLHPHRG